ncbi:hypothetical protein [Thermococcus sp. GR6]|uniref:hypothetical protein n=1 Tax=Thermococcus sp. GR6 TaxID=1638256 RepID=UPI0014304C7A|nr:hypothetical protein [Thermococcus sp. GR6]NJE43332.1 hypothetical protein [Thermococcus sp. GR6]
MARAFSLAALLIFLTFFWAGFLLLVSFLVLGLADLNPQPGYGISIVLSLLVLLSLTKRLLLSIRVDENASMKLALVVGFLLVLVFYLTIPRFCGGCGG